MIYFLMNSVSQITNERISGKIDQLPEIINAVSFKGDISPSHDNHYYRARNKPRDRHRRDRRSGQDSRLRDTGYMINDVYD